MYLKITKAAVLYFMKKLGIVHVDFVLKEEQLAAVNSLLYSITCMIRQPIHHYRVQLVHLAPSQLNESWTDLWA